MSLAPEGLRLGDDLLPLWSGSVHYWRLDPRSWRAALEGLAALGARLVDTYVPWSAHELASGELDFGESDPRLDLDVFLKTAADVGLRAIVRPGPHVNAELSTFGIPERVIWDERCQARSPRGHRVVLPTLPLAFPVPSYASSAFLDEACRWLQAAGTRLAPLAWPEGPVVLLQIDDEAALYFRDGVYDQDRHPDAIASYRKLLRRRYRRAAAARAAYGDPSWSFATAEPPRELDAQEPQQLARHLDWAEHQEGIVEEALARFREALEAAGLRGIPTSHNLPMAEGATALDPERIGRAVDLVTLDYYHRATPLARAEIVRRTTELVTRSEARAQPAFAAEMAAGFAAHLPVLRERDNAFAVLTALAYGLRGFNAYMLVERDRWIGAPLGASGRRLEGADFWARLFAALGRTRFHELRRETAVRIVVPRGLRRLARVCHAFGPVSPAAFALGGRGATLGTLEDGIGLASPAAIEAEEFLGRLERALDARRVPWARQSGDLVREALSRARWTIIVSSGGLEAEIVEAASRAVERGARVSIGPHPPERDERMLPARTRWGGTVVPLDAESVERAVATEIDRLGLPVIAADPAAVSTTIHRDVSGRPAVLFVINPTAEDLAATAEVGGALRAEDALTLEPVAVENGRAVVSVPAHAVRMLALSSEA